MARVLDVLVDDAGRAGRARQGDLRAAPQHGARASADRVRADAQDREARSRSDPADRRLRRAVEARAEQRSEEHTSELQSRENLVCRLLLETKNATACSSPAASTR